MKITEFGNPILRQKTETLSVKDIRTERVQNLITKMQKYIIAKKLGVGLAAPQAGENLSLAVICIRPSKHRKHTKELDLVIVNPEITKTYGRRTQLWEGCISAGSLNSSLFAKVPRYKKLQLKYRDEKARLHKKIFEGLPAHVIQHEVDHLNGILFVDRVKDSKTFMTYKEYLKLVKENG